MGNFDLTGLVAVVMVFSIPILAILSGILKERYRAQRSSLSDEDRERLQKLGAIAEKMNERIETLESILDAEVPDWREDYDQRV